MPNLPHTQFRTIDVAAGFLPYPATKLIVTQFLVTRQEPPFWAWISVGAFLDQDDRIIWSTELFVAVLDAEFESDDDTEGEIDESLDVSESLSEQAHTQAVNQWEAGQTAFVRQLPSQTHLGHLFPPHSQPAHPHFIHPPAFWDPTRQGPVPGHWQAAFDRSSHRWVHTWQPFGGI
ncbi:hypothetical protein CP533_5195 [Ophiocordyceps camponoti-saundersi (nom. inval.)]|nr:hypothetical protein CP533_5195 [Ophiocordyceps camponoti-saundersi (nom. inval.)]